MWGEAHILAGILFQHAICGDELSWWLILPATLAVGSHLYLDDANTAPIKIYHKLGESWRKWLTIGLRVPIGVAIAWLLWSNPIFLICGLLAFLPWDIEWVLKPLGVKYEAHRLFDHPWLWKERYGLLVNFLVIILLGIGVTKWVI